MKDEKRLYIIGTIAYILVVLLIYILLAGMPFKMSDTNLPASVMGIDIKLLGKSLLSGFVPAFLIVLMINKYIWRWNWFRFIAGINTPYVHGRWEGFIKSN